MIKQMVAWPITLVMLTGAAILYGQTNYNKGKDGAKLVYELMDVNEKIQLEIYTMNVSSVKGETYDTGKVERLIDTQISLEKRIEENIREGGIYGETMLSRFYATAHEVDRKNEEALHQKFYDFLDKQSGKS